jgi:hypothetical protein
MLPPQHFYGRFDAEFEPVVLFHVERHPSEFCQTPVALVAFYDCRRELRPGNPSTGRGYEP